MKQVSVGSQIKAIAGLQGTKDLSEWEEGFVDGIVKWTNEGANTGRLTEKQLEIIERIYSKHFAG